MSRAMVLFLLALALALPGCKKKEEKKEEAPKTENKKEAPPVEEKKSAPPAEEPAAEEEKAPPPQEKDVRGEIRNKYDDYTFVVNPTAAGGPPRPPIGENENISAAQLTEKWTEVPVVDPLHGSPKKLDTPLDAALDVATMNNRGEVYFTIVQMGDFEAFKAKFLPMAEAYMAYLQQKGLEDTTGAVPRLEEKLKRQFEDRMGRYDTLVGPVKREDRFDGVLGDSMARLARWTFEYTDRQGQTRRDCLLYLLVGSGWQVIDIGCEENKEVP